MAKFKFKQEYLIWIVGILFLMSVMPGEGTKASSQQSVVATEYPCVTDLDCPTCVGGWFGGDNESVAESELSFFGELAYAKCDEGTCRLSEYCLVWDCGGVDESQCKSVKQTVLDNTLGRLKEHPVWIFFIIGGIVIYFLLRKG